MRRNITTPTPIPCALGRFLEHAKVLSWLFLMVIVSSGVARGVNACSQFIPLRLSDLPAVFPRSGHNPWGDVYVPMGCCGLKQLDRRRA